MLFVGLFWIWIDSSRSARRVVFPAHGDSVALGSDRIEPSFGKPAHVAANNGHPERNPADAIYDDLPPDDVDRNFLLRYWRGKLSLAFSFWTVGVLVSLLAALVTVALSVLLDVSGEYKPRTIFCFYALTWTSVTLLTIWKVVGLWRSAGRYMSERRKQDRSGFWGGVVKVIVAFSVLGTIADIGRNAIPQMGEVYRMAFLGDPDLPDYSLRIMRNGTEIEIVGGFKYGLSADLDRLLKAAPQVAVVHLDSTGGRIAEAMQVHDIIQQRRLVTYVANQCLSACTIAFAGGRERWLGDAGRLGFHAPAFSGMTSADLASTVNDQKVLFVRDGFDPYFVARALSTPSTSMLIPTNQELLAARVVTNIASPEKFAISGLAAPFTEAMASDVVKEIAPPVAAIGDRDPDTAKAIVQKFHQMYLDGNSTSEAIAAIRERLDAEIGKYRPLADDETILLIARLYADEYRHLSKLNKQVCFRYASAQERDISEYLTPELNKRWLDLQARIINTAAQRPPAPQDMVDAGWSDLFKILEAGPQKKNLIFFGTVPRADQYADYCDLYTAVYQAVLQLPRDKMIALVRILLAYRV
ncbi:hypothetical protein G3545_15945 [Starkeya sp. ORNL1]|uniref:COG3904 family protein n=1 Tax=Starkeya sp. ORNL1 TaxID=2709380 RepID=UPI001462A96D|nr:hypothetical protein [Starkeya sp. ORNL1]QJP15010.1 hypothetical protein G3545_15945 [Starkeya sp. ORNL1]